MFAYSQEWEMKGYVSGSVMRNIVMKKNVQSIKWGKKISHSNGWLLIPLLLHMFFVCRHFMYVCLWTINAHIFDDFFEFSPGIPTGFICIRYSCVIHRAMFK